MTFINLTLFVLLSPVLGFSQPPGLKGEPIADLSVLSGKVDQLFASVEGGRSPGCAVAVIKDGKVIHQRGYGIADLDHGVAITPRTVFNVASMSKQFTAMSVALLARQGQISLDDDVRKYVPEIPAYQRPITIRHLIHHTSGLRDYTELIEMSDRRIENIHTDKDVLRILSRQKGLNFQPGDQHLYNNSGYFLLGVIVERVTGKSLGAFQKEFIFEPLGMRDTRLYDDRSMVVERRARGYLAKGDGTFAARASLWDRVGDGGLLTTVGDLALWDENFYAPKVGSADLFDQMTSPGRLNNGQAFEYAFGLEPVSYRGLPVIMHGGGIRGFRAQMYRFPRQRFTAICLCNNGAISPTQMVERIADLYLADQFRSALSAQQLKKGEPSPAGEYRPSDGELARFSGLYASQDESVVRRLYVRDGQLWYSRPGGSENELQPLTANRFAMLGVRDEVEIAFENARDRSPQMSVVINGTNSTRYHRVEAPLASPAELKQYEGIYSSDELKTHYTIALRGGDLIVLKKSGDEYKLAPRFADAYSSPEGQWDLKFSRKAGKRVSGFSLSTEGTKGVLFNKL